MSIDANNMTDTLVPTTGVLSVDQGSLAITTVGTGLRIKEGTNATMGKTTLTLGTKTVACTAVTANSRIFLSPVGSPLNLGIQYISSQTAGVGFTITSLNILDGSTINWLLVEPA